MLTEVKMSASVIQSQKTTEPNVPGPVKEGESRRENIVNHKTITDQNKTLGPRKTVRAAKGTERIE